MSSSHTPLSSSHQRKTNKETVLANAPQPEHQPQKRPYLLKTLQRGLGTRVLGDTLDWDALAHYHLDASVVSLDNVYKGLNGDPESYYFLWLAVRKVLAEAPNVTRFSGARVCADQKTQYLNELLDAALEQFLAELGDALMNFVEGPHCTMVDPRNDGDPDVIRTNARSLVARFEKLGRSKDMLMVAIPASESGIEAAARLQREDGINVNLTCVSGVMHATACAQSGAVALTLPIAKMRDWRRSMGRDVGHSKEDVVGAGGEDAETIAAYFDLHGLSSTTGLIVGKMDHVEDACPLAALAALSFDANQLKKAEWCTAYPPVPLALPDHALRRAKALSPPLPPPPSGGDAETMLKRMDAQTFSAFAGITHVAVGSGRAAMSMIADIARKELEWQLFVKQPLSFLDAVAAAARRRRRCHPSVRLKIPAPPSLPGAGASASASASVVPAAGAGASGQRDHARRLLGKRRRSLAEVAEAMAEAPDSPRPPPEKRAKRGHAADPPHPFRLRLADFNPENEGGGQVHVRRPGARAQPALDEECAIRERLERLAEYYSDDDHDEGRGRPLRKWL